MSGRRGYERVSQRADHDIDFARTDAEVKRQAENAARQIFGH